jgi:hypothetical protein
MATPKNGFRKWKVAGPCAADPADQREPDQRGGKAGHGDLVGEGGEEGG